jgi:FkbM family methyltransferase
MNRHAVSVIEDPRFDAYWAYVHHGQWEPQTFALLQTFVHPGAVVVDIGAWIGPTTLFAAIHAKHVLAFEPDPEAFAMLQANVAANPTLAQRISLSKACISTTDGPVRMGSHSSETGGDGASSMLYADSSVGWEVEGVRLETALDRAGIAQVDVLKMDVEGAESMLVPALADHLLRNQPTLMLSMHPHFMAEPVDDTRAIADVLAGYPHLYTAEMMPITVDYLYDPANLGRAYEVVATQRSPENLCFSPWARQAAEVRSPEIAQLQADARTLHALAGLVVAESARRLHLGQSTFPADRLTAIKTGIAQSKHLPDSTDPAELKRFIRTFRRLYSMHMR